MSDTPPLYMSEFKQLMRRGQAAYSQGELEYAHQCWQRAAMLNPHAEEVWQALLAVLTDEDDRRVCLENILAISPHNPYARHALQTGQALPVGKPSPQSHRALWMLRLVWVALVLLSGIVLASIILLLRFLL